MRSIVRGFGAVLMIAALALASCQRQGPDSSEPAGPPSDAEREAQLAAEQLAALGGPANAQQRAMYEGEFQASGGIDATGAEGAWELRLLNDYAQFARPGLGEDGGLTGDRDYREHGMRVVAGPLTVTLMQQQCTASGVELPYVAHVLFEGVAYQGCARRGIAEGGGPTWASVLPELIPAIDACLARASSPRQARVTFATTLDEADVAVRLREASGERRECVVRADGSTVHLYESLSDVDRRPGEGEPEFQRGGGQPRACAQAAMDRGGSRLGWIIPRDC